MRYIHEIQHLHTAAPGERLWGCVCWSLDKILFDWISVCLQHHWIGRLWQEVFVYMSMHPTSFYLLGSRRNSCIQIVITLKNVCYLDQNSNFHWQPIKPTPTNTWPQYCLHLGGANLIDKMRYSKRNAKGMDLRLYETFQVYSSSSVFFTKLFTPINQLQKLVSRGGTHTLMHSGQFRVNLLRPRNPQCGCSESHHFGRGVHVLC